MFHARTKYIDVRFHFVRDVISKRDLVLKKVDTEENSTDALMKTVTSAKLDKCLRLIGIGEYPGVC